MKSIKIEKDGRIFNVEYDIDIIDSPYLVILSIDGITRSRLPFHAINQMEEWVMYELKSEIEFIEECRVNELIDNERGLSW